MNKPSQESLSAAYGQPLEALDPAQPEFFRDNQMWAYFDRLRAEDPVHYTPASAYGPYWSITKFDDIKTVAADHNNFSSTGGASIEDDPRLKLPMFIDMDPPAHSTHRSMVQPAFSSDRIKQLSQIVQAHAAKTLDELPVGLTFDWVDRVSVEMTCTTLAALFGIPHEDRRLIGLWSDTVTSRPRQDGADSPAEATAILNALLRYFMNFWNNPQALFDPEGLIAMLVRKSKAQNLPVESFLGNVLLLLVAGNDSTRNSISGSLLALSSHPHQFAEMRKNQHLIPSMAAEAIRWQTPIAHMIRTANRDTVVRQKLIRAGEKVVLWFISGNRDEEVIKNPYDFEINRSNPRQHLAFGFGIHHCIGNRLAELQVAIVWQEVLKRFDRIDMIGSPERICSNFLNGFVSMPASISTSKTP